MVENFDDASANTLLQISNEEEIAVEAIAIMQAVREGEAGKRGSMGQEKRNFFVKELANKIGKFKANEELVEGAANLIISLMSIKYEDPKKDAKPLPKRPAAPPPNPSEGIAPLTPPPKTPSPPKMQPLRLSPSATWSRNISQEVILKVRLSEE